MKKSIFIISFILFSINTFGNNIKGRVTFNYKPQNDSVKIVIFNHDGSFRPDLTVVDTILNIKSGNFELQLQTGTFICRFIHPEIKITDVPFVINSSNSTVGVNVKLEKLSLPSEVKKVQLCIRRSNKKIKILSLSKSGTTWSMPKDIKTYFFRVNNSQYYHRLNHPVTLNKILFYYENEYHGEDIYYSEAECFKKESRVVLNSSEVDLQHCYHIFKEIASEYEGGFLGSESFSNQENAAYFSEISLLFDRILEEESPFFRQIVIEPYLGLIARHHPVNFQIYQFHEKKQYNEINTLKLSDGYKEMEQMKYNLLKCLDTKSIFVSGRFLYAISHYWMKFTYPEKYIEFDLPFGFFSKLEYDFKNQTSSYYAKGEMLYMVIKRMKKDNPTKALQLLYALEKEYPRHPYVNTNSLLRLKADLLRKEDSVAPDFELTDLNGETIKLSDYKGRYVFLDFWGSWCAPCLGELPHVKALSDNLPGEKLIVIGVVCHDKKDIVDKIIQERNIDYINVMADERILDDYGVASFPTTYLIDQQGKIVGKNLRGSSLSANVKNILNL